MAELRWELTNIAAAQTCVMLVMSSSRLPLMKYDFDAFARRDQHLRLKNSFTATAFYRVKMLQKAH